jgi:hypothetical protein
VVAVVALAAQFGVGIAAPLYAVSLMTLGLIPWTLALALLVWAGIATQLGALASGRYRGPR